MKKPRIADFDPTAAERAALGSPLDDMPAIKPPSKKPDVQPQSVTPATEPDRETVTTTEQNKASIDSDTVVPRYHDTVKPRYQDTTIPKVSEEDLLEAIRKAVRQVGKEPATQRLTLEEKQKLKDIEYTYDRLGVKTSSNEVIRIAINYIVNDYASNGKASVLARVLEKLNS